MTRRTPQPGDSYTKGDVTWLIERVDGGQVYAHVCEPGRYVGLGLVWQFELSGFHHTIAIATWGEP
jgi:hypothetical protein